jgi:hypothetical protein
MVSYRDSSDLELARRFYDRLTSDGWKVWFDKVCIGATVNWRKAFMTGVMKSEMIVTILSKGAINHTCESANPTGVEIADMKKRSFPELKEDSPCDNVLLEHRLAVEFAIREWFKIYPIFVGKKHTSGNYSDYFRDGSHPSTEAMKTTVVKAVETQLQKFFALHSLEVKQPNMTVEMILQDVTDCNGKKFGEGYLDDKGDLVGGGDLDVAFESAIEEINKALIQAGRTPTPHTLTSSSSPSL